MPQCLGLSDSDLASLLAQGWTQVSGPFNTLAECNANCGSSSASSSVPLIPNGCCPGGTPSVLHATLSSPDPTCACISGVITLNYNGSSWIGTGPLGSCGTSITITLTCSGTAWNFTFTTGANCSSSGGPVSPVTCNPFHATVNAAADTKCCNGISGPTTYTITFTL
jgi:hypothetical protein